MKNRKSAKPNSKIIDRLSMFEWECIVAAWRYYEHRRTISGGAFPGDIIKRYWGEGNCYSDKVRWTIANQFAFIDHGIGGEEDWKSADCYNLPWAVFYQFCRAWCQGFTHLTLKLNKEIKEVEAFYTESDGKWREKNFYISHLEYGYINKEFISKISAPKSIDGEIQTRCSAYNELPMPAPVSDGAAMREILHPDPDWQNICAKCKDGDIEPKFCAYYGEPNGCNSPIYGEHPTTEKSSAVGNAAAMREVVMALAAVILPPRDKAGEGGWLAWIRAMHGKARAALSAPPRNCDIYTDIDSTLSACHEDRGYCQSPIDERRSVISFMLSTSTDGEANKDEGEPNGSK